MKKSDDPDYDKNRRARWRNANKEKHAEHNRAWRKSHPEECRILDARKRARRRNAVGYFTASEVSALLRKQRERCAACFILISEGFHRDHIIPLARGGDNTIRNIQLLCAPCNQSKGFKDPIEWARQLWRLI